MRDRFKTIEQLLEEQEELSQSSESRSPMVFTDHTGREAKTKTMESEFTLSKVDRNAVGFEVCLSLNRIPPSLSTISSRSPLWKKAAFWTSGAIACSERSSAAKKRSS